MKKRVSFLMIFLLALLLTGCSEKSGGSTQYQVYYISTSGTKLSRVRLESLSMKVYRSASTPLAA